MNMRKHALICIHVNPIRSGSTTKGGAQQSRAGHAPNHVHTDVYIAAVRLVVGEAGAGSAPRCSCMHQ